VPFFDFSEEIFIKIKKIYKNNYNKEEIKSIILQKKKKNNYKKEIIIMIVM
jgi:hypothetical protein